VAAPQRLEPANRCKGILLRYRNMVEESRNFQGGGSSKNNLRIEVARDTWRLVSYPPSTAWSTRVSSSTNYLFASIS